MEYIKKDSKLRLTDAEYTEMKPFFESLGVKSRITYTAYDDGCWMYEIEVENPYKFWADKRTKELAENELKTEHNYW